MESAPSIAQILVWETLGTAVLIVLGTGVVATVVLERSKGSGGGWLLINFGWAMGVFAGASIAWRSGAHINPAVTLATAISGDTPWTDVPFYFGAQLAGAIIGATLAWLAFKKSFDDDPALANSVSIFATGPVVKHYGWNVITEVIATFVLVFFILTSPTDNGGLGYAAVAFVVLGIGNSLGAPTGYAINPARDLGPRIAHALLPIRGKGTSDWSYAWVPIVGPLVGSALAAFLFVATKGTLT